MYTSMYSKFILQGVAKKAMEMNEAKKSPSAVGSAGLVQSFTLVRAVLFFTERFRFCCAPVVFFLLFKVSRVMYLCRFQYHA